MNLMSCPLVTCIITCYKKFDYLFDAIDSVLIQDYPNIELLITDDGSVGFPQDDVEAYIQKRANENIRHWRVNHHENNVGTVRNLNSMLRIARGEYFIGLDGDDVFYDETVFTKIIDRFQKTGVDFLSCSRLQCTEELEAIALLPTEDNMEMIKKLNTARKQFDSFSVFKFVNIASGSAMYYSRKNLDRMGYFDEKYRNWQDGPRIAEYARLGNMIPTAFDIIAVKYRDGGVSNNPGGNTASFVHITADRQKYIEKVVKTNRWNRNFRCRRKILFWYMWDRSKNLRRRMILLLLFPAQFVGIIAKKLTKQSIR